MVKKRRTFTREFKIEAVKLVTQKGMSVAEAARSLGLHENLLRSWKQALDKENQGDQQAFPGHGNRLALEEEIHRLKAENRRLQMECDILTGAPFDSAEQPCSSLRIAPWLAIRPVRFSPKNP